MERAAGHLARGIVRAGGRAAGLRVALLCGRGNNGGDGLAAGRRLLGLGAAPVAVLVAGEDALGPDGVRELRAYRAAGGRLAATVDGALAAADVAVDCLLGTGARGAPRPPLDAAVGALLAFPGPVVACDLPTGVDADTGEVPGSAVPPATSPPPAARARGGWRWGPPAGTSAWRGSATSASSPPPTSPAAGGWRRATAPAWSPRPRRTRRSAPAGWW